MKTYEKPRLVALSLSGNDRLCGDCAGVTTLYNNQDLAQFILMMTDPSRMNDGIDRNDFVGIFGSDETGCNSYPVESYCKFSSSGGNLVAWS